MGYSKHVYKLIGKMEEKGYSYNDLESYSGCLKFDYECQILPLIFTSWKKVEEWVYNVI